MELLFLTVFSAFNHFFKGLQVSCTYRNVLVQEKWLKQSFHTGGLDVRAQEAALRMNPDIVIATPGRLIDHLHNSPNFSLRNIEILVLDEADRYDINYFIYSLFFVAYMFILFQDNAVLAYLSWEQNFFDKIIVFEQLILILKIRVLQCKTLLQMKYCLWNIFKTLL